jgi:copper chaperone CopZ
LGRVDLHFANSSCAHCARLVTRSLHEVKGVLSVEVDRFGQKVMVGFDPSLVTVDSIQSAMEKAGYPTRLLSERLAPFPPKLLPSIAA